MGIYKEKIVEQNKEKEV